MHVVSTYVHGRDVISDWYILLLFQLIIIAFSFGFPPQSESLWENGAPFA